MANTSLLRTRWAAIGAAVAVTLGTGGLAVVDATVTSGERTVFVAITPCRLVDTRPASTVGPKSSPVGPAETHTVTAHGTNGDCTIPANAVALSLNVTALGATTPTFLAIWPAGATRPDASSLNPSPGQPPTPNAVTTDLSIDGRFSIFNLQGNVDVLVDVNGYYADHNHDDRYDTKAQVDTKIEQAIADQPWSIAIAAADLQPSGSGNWPAITFGSGIATGMAFDDGVFSRVFYGIALPERYNAGADLEVEMRWLPITGFGAPVLPCDSVWWANNPVVNRPGSAGVIAATTWQPPRGGNTSQTRVTATAAQFNTDTVGTATMTIAGSALQPGDILNLTLNRDGDEVDDTCEGMMVTGLVVREAAA